MTFLLPDREVFWLAGPAVLASGHMDLTTHAGPDSQPVHCELTCLPDLGQRLVVALEWLPISQARREAGDMVDLRLRLRGGETLPETGVAMRLDFPITRDAHADPVFATIGSAAIRTVSGGAVYAVELGFADAAGLHFALQMSPARLMHIASAHHFAPGADARLRLILHLRRFEGEAELQISRVFAGLDYDPYRFNPHFERIAHLEGRPDFPGGNEAKAEFMLQARAAAKDCKFLGVQGFITPFIVRREGEPAFPILIGTPNSILWYGIDPWHRIESYHRDNILRPGEAVLDCGAHAGQMAALFGLVAGADQRVVAFDPFPQNTLQVQTQAVLNGLPRLEAVRAGVGERRGRVDLSILGQSTARTSASRDLIGVDIVPLDDYRDVRPGLVKLDVEGAEVAALRGAQALLHDCRPRLFVELHPQMLGDFDHTVEDFFAAIPAKLYDVKYRVEGLDGDWRPWAEGEAARVTAPALVLAEPRAE